jgi:hypothetical protein
MFKKRLATTAATAIALALCSTAASAGPAAAATQKSSCTDGADRVWQAKAKWGARYRTSDGTTRVKLSSVRWTTKAQALQTQVEIKTYGSSGRLEQTLTDDKVYDYNAGTTWFGRNPVNPVVRDGQATVSLKVGLHGTADCVVTFTEPGGDPAGGSGSQDTVLKTAGLTATSVTVTWSAVAGAAGYLVSRDGVDSSGTGAWSTTDPATARSRTFTGLLPETRYTFAVQPVGGVAKSISVVTAASTDPGTSSGTAPTGVSGTWRQVFGDEFDGTSVDPNKWSLMEGRNMNHVTAHASNVKVSDGKLLLTLASSTSGAFLSSNPQEVRGTGSGYDLPVGGFTEARVYFPGNGTTIYNWPAWWVSGPNWPAAGESDIAEGLGPLTVNYHSSSGAHNQGAVPGIWSNAYHVYGMHRKAHSVDVYWDGKLVKSYATDDNGAPQSLLLNVGSSSSHAAAYGAASQMKVDYVRAFQQI